MAFRSMVFQRPWDGLGGSSMICITCPIWIPRLVRTMHRGRGSGHYTYRNERQVIYRLLKLIEDYGIRATWAVVGHLFLSECQSVDGHKHPEITRPPYSWFEKDWFDADPCSDENAHPMWYGRDIVARILKCTVPQEIGSHTFSHIIVGDPDCRPEDFDSELRRCRQLAKSHGITLKSFVFPRNSVGHLNVLVVGVQLQRSVVVVNRCVRISQSAMSNASVVQCGRV